MSISLLKVQKSPAYTHKYIPEADHQMLHVVNLRSGRIYRFCPETKTQPKPPIWAGLESEFPLPPLHKIRWESIKQSLFDRLRDVEQDMIAEQARETHFHKRDPRRRRYNIELRMSGRQSTPSSHQVSISPCIWILCGSRWCWKKMQKATRNLRLPRNLFSQPVEVLEGGPTFNASQSLIPRSQLQHDIERKSGLGHQGGTILHHIEVSSNQTCSSVCGLLCCTTFMKDECVVDQHVSRVGGILTETFFDCDFEISPLALTTAHGLFDLLLSQIDVQKDQDHLQISLNSSDYDSSSDSDSDPELVSEGEDDVNSNNEIQRLGSRDPSKVHEWAPLGDVVGINFMGERFSSDEDQRGEVNEGQRADYTILRSDALKGGSNVISSSSKAEIKTFTTNDKLDAGPISLVLSLDNVVEAFLLPDVEDMPSMRGPLRVRKIEMDAPLAVGTSGTWLCRGDSFCGMVIAIYPGEPLALFMSAEDLLNDMQHFFPGIWRPSGSNLVTFPNQETDRASSSKDQDKDNLDQKDEKSVDMSADNIAEPVAVDRPTTSTAHAARSVSGGGPKPAGSRRNQGGKPTMTYIWVWYCSNCSTGPLNVSADAACPYCHHWRCGSCSTTQIATPARR